jgi:hypothetical protein
VCFSCPSNGSWVEETTPDHVNDFPTGGVPPPAAGRGAVACDAAPADAPGVVVAACANARCVN